MELRNPPAIIGTQLNPIIVLVARVSWMVWQVNIRDWAAAGTAVNARAAVAKWSTPARDKAFGAVGLSIHFRTKVPGHVFLPRPCPVDDYEEKKSSRACST